jgi:hypothetical protein
MVTTIPDRMHWKWIPHMLVKTDIQRTLYEFTEFQDTAVSNIRQWRTYAHIRDWSMGHTKHHYGRVDQVIKSADILWLMLNESICK